MRQLAPLGLLAAMLGCTGCDDSQPEQPPYVTTGYAISEQQVARTLVTFTDVTLSAGIDFVHETGAFGDKWMPETMGSGGGFLDFDGDGWLDVLLVNGTVWPGRAEAEARPTLHLYRNTGTGTFEDVTAAAGLEISLYGMGAAFGDYDGDRDLDIYITAVGDNVLLRNDDGRFVDVTARAGVQGNPGDASAPKSWSTAAAWLDYDRDGLIDLFVCNYVRWTPATDLFTTFDGKNKSYATPEQYPGDSCRLYRNIARERFADVSSDAGVLNPNGKSLGVAVADLNDDGWSDLVVANDTERNFLYLNEGDGTFSDVAVRSGIGYDERGRARAGMGIDVADLAGDGVQAIAIGNFSQEPVSLYTQIGEGLFQDLAGQARLTRNTILKLTFGLLFVDLDLDGRLDLVTANGHIEPEINAVQKNIMFAQTPQVFINTGSGAFTDVSHLVGAPFSEPVVARGLAAGDIDRDGDLDLLLTVNGGRPRLLRNDLPRDAANSISLELDGTGPNGDALGASVTAYSAGLIQRRLVRTGSSYLSQSDFRSIVLGLDKEEVMDSVVVRWPTTGRQSRIGSLPAGRRYSVSEAESKATDRGPISRRE